MLIVGCGYIGRRVAQRLLARGETVYGVVRSAASAEQLQTFGVQSVACDLDQTAVPPELCAAQEVLYCAPPPASGRNDTRMRRFLADLSGAAAPRRILYLSTTGVYGDCAGAWVDESWPVQPHADRSYRRWDAEQQLQSWRADGGGEVVILRVAGIYGPGKLPLARLQRGEPMVAEQDAPWTNRIHADDLVSACLAAMQAGVDGEVYNACDGAPGNMAEYFNQVADLAGLPRPPSITLAEAGEQLSAGLLSYLAESRRLRNTKLLRDTGLQLRYPSLRLGLPSCFD